MRTPIKPLPAAVLSWTNRVRWLRRLDAVAAWVLLWALAAPLLQGISGTAQAVLAAALVGLGSLVAPLRARWRPISAWAALSISRPLRAGDRAWHVTPEEAELVIVTARQGLRVVIAHRGQGPAEGIAVRRTRVLLLPADSL
ncbi:MAG: hypothetical protein ACE5JD_15225 [Candidatus Methylomirabilia bacterium]